MRIGTRIGLSFGGVLLMMAVIVVTTQNSMVGVNERIQTIVNESNPKLALIGVIRDEFRSRKEIVWNILRLDEEQSEQQEAENARFNKSVARYAAAVTELSEISLSEAEQKIIEKIRENGARTYPVISESIRFALDGFNEEGVELFVSEGDPLQGELFAALNEMQLLQQNLSAEAMADAERLYASARNINYLMGGGAALLAMIVGWLLLRSIVQPVHRAVSAAERIAENDFSSDLFNDRSDEVGEVLSALQLMQQNIQQRIEQERSAANESTRLREALNNVSTNVLVSDRDQRIIFVNRSMGNFLHGIEGEVQKQNPDFSVDTLLALHYPQFHPHLAKKMELLDGLRDESYEATLGIGGRTMDLVVSAVIDDDGNYLGLVFEWVDVTEERDATFQLEQMVLEAIDGKLGRRLNTDNYQGAMEGVASVFNRLLDQVSAPLREMAALLPKLADGDLIQRIDGDYRGEFGIIKDAYNNSVDNIARITAEIIAAARQIDRSVAEVSAGADDLSQRTAQQAASLEETSASMDEMASTVNSNAESAMVASELSGKATSQTRQGSEVVSQTVSAMERIRESSQKISEITSLIDGIAFQTNLLALNAAVEAARAGEHGRGFAVVAGEVRTLAQRSADAAREIATLIEDSNRRVNEGGVLVDASGEALDEIHISIKKVNDIVQEIAAASGEQSAGINQVNQAIAQLDSVNQQNSALVEETSAASSNVYEQSTGLSRLMGFFRVDDTVMQNTVGAAAGKEAMVFIKARSAHLAWKSRIRGFLDGVIEMDEQQAVSHQECALGQWLYSEGLAQYGGMVAMGELEQKHEQMHTVIREIITLKQGGEERAAEEQFGEVDSLSGEVVGLLDRLERQIAHNGQVDPG